MRPREALPGCARDGAGSPREGPTSGSPFMWSNRTPDPALEAMELPGLKPDLHQISSILLGESGFRPGRFQLLDLRSQQGGEFGGFARIRCSEVVSFLRILREEIQSARCGDRFEMIGADPETIPYLSGGYVFPVASANRFCPDALLHHVITTPVGPG